MSAGLVLDRSTCDRARIARDPRFDGSFFTGVLTTRIYCRPTCPVKPAKSRNVVFFPTAAAAERAGFRPCLRCRPETAPGTPAWHGAAATVSRALRLIERGFLDDGRSVEDLADTLGMTARPPWRRRGVCSARKRWSMRPRCRWPRSHSPQGLPASDDSTLRFARCTDDR